MNFTWPSLDTNGTACLYIDDIFSRMTDMRSTVEEDIAEPTEIIIPIVGALVSLVFLFVGAKLFRITAALAAFGFAFWIVYAFLRDSGSEEVGCEARVIAASIIGAAAALSAGCVYKAGLFLVGAAAFSGSVHMIFSAFPTLHSVDGVPQVGGRSLAYYALIVLGAIAGGLLLRWHSTFILEISTACVGGAAMAYSLYSITSIAGADIENWVFMLVGIGSALCGIFVQRHLRLHGCKQITNAERRRERVIDLGRDDRVEMGHARRERR